MKKIDIKKILKRYSVRKLNLNDVQMIYTFCKKIHSIINIVAKSFLLS